MITSAAHRRWDGDVVITDAEAARLPAPSVVRCAKIATIEAAKAERIGVLPAEMRAKVKAFLAATLP